ncbi:MAG TPA: GNAT family N-acetyltransferase [Cryptosporangiaceae bacterium]|nr:GNAT family N-acetyltransferase [Cryptosporangiaceae bacterium]
MTELTVVRWSAQDVCAHLDELLAVYGAAMGYSRALVATRRGILAAHTGHDAFRAVATVDPEGRVVGFGYGYRSAPGQWWHDQVRAGLDPAAYATWMTDCFELVELHVLPHAQGRGLGHRQLALLLDGLPLRQVLLSTPEGESRAWRLYRRTGFVDVLRDYTFAGDTRAFAVLGRSLPLEADSA